MRIVWASAAFVAGVGTAIVFGFTPGHALPAPVFLFFCGAATLISAALVVSRRQAAIAILCVVFLAGSWRGGDAVHQFEDSDRHTSATTRESTDPSGMIGRFRMDISDELNRSNGPFDAGLPAALLVGNRSGINEQTTRDFRAAGLAHLLAISGLHVSLVGGTAMALSVAAIGRRRVIYLIIPLLIVLGYAALAGFAPPITRAAIMFSVFILGRSLGRGSHTIAAISLAALIMVAYSPDILTSLSFQLSFAAMLAISFVAPVMDGLTEFAKSNEKNSRDFSLLGRVRHFVLGSLAVSLASTIGTLPLIALHFGAIPIWGAVATILAYPAVPILIFSSAALVLANQTTITVLSGIIAIPVSFLSAYITWIAAFFAHLPPTPIDASAWTVSMTVACCAFIGSLVLSWPWSANFAKRTVVRCFAGFSRLDFARRGPPYAQLGLVTLLVFAGTAFWGATLAAPSSKPHLSVRFLQTTLGESILIETPGGNRMLIDGGGDDYQIAETLTELIPFTDRNIDVVMLTHTDADHVGGLPEVLERFRTETVVHSGMNSPSNAYSSWTDAIANHNNVKIAHTGMRIFLDEGVVLEVVSAGCFGTTDPCADDNDASIVSILKYGSTSFLLTGDIEKPAEAFLAATHQNLRSTVLKAPHHGSITSSTEKLLNATKPVAIVVAVGSQNRYGHPHPDVMSRLARAVGVERVFRTDRLGTLDFRTDGERLWMVR